jgi:hypothetical protein
MSQRDESYCIALCMWHTQRDNTAAFQILEAYLLLQVSYWESEG